ncbi:hypothetical protein GCM10022254_46730 [Actinomadura meridiana]|uniref:OmpR/PhoB-type domain-containing protein n=1 Tax=Actinomadura meridiana TaxID=559626 RepID=A0ABP8CAI7_9ACTN
MRNDGTNFDTMVIGAKMGGPHQSHSNGRRPAHPGNGDARRIAELEREVRELRRANEILKVYFAKELDLDVRPAPPALEFGPGNPSGTDLIPPTSRVPADPMHWAPARPQRASDEPRPMAEFRALGPIEAVVAGRLVDLGAPKQRALLAVLISKVGQPVAVDVIVEELWTGNPPPSAITSLQAYVANLRRVLEPDRAPRTPATVLRTFGRGYLLDNRVVEVDIDRFGERATAGWRALDRGRAQQALREFEAGLTLWRGQAFAEVADTAYVRPEVARLEELRLSVIEGRCAALLAVGAHEMAVAELEAFTQAHPLREYGCELLSLALYRSGRQAEALAVLRTNQKRLAEELGIDPRPALQHLENEILNHAPALDWRPLPGGGF